VQVTVLTVDGRRVNTLHDGRLAAGTHTLAWDGRSARGRPVGAGVYLAVVQANDDRRLVRLVLVR
jgi:flagellar hook assembly protein FlgD